MNKKDRVVQAVVLFLALLLLCVCQRKPLEISSISDLQNATIGIPPGEIADRLVRTSFPKAKYVYFDTALDAALEVKSGKIDAAVYVEHVMSNIIAKNPGLKMLSEKLSTDNYGVAVHLDNIELKDKIDIVIDEIHTSGLYTEMLNRWFPQHGNPHKMPVIELVATNGVLTFGTAVDVEPFAFLDENNQVVGFDVELAYHIAKQLKMGLNVQYVAFDELLEGVQSKRFDFIASSIAISEERAKVMLFSKPYYIGGMVAIVKEK